MTNLKDAVSSLLAGSARVAVLGAGSILSADDAAGVLITDSLIERFGETSERFAVFSGGTAPECFTGEIKKFKPDLVLLIDAADLGLTPGEVRSVDPRDVEGVSFSTHMLPLKVMLDYLNKEIGCKTAILGIQPRCVEFGEEMCGDVRSTVDELVEAVAGFFSNQS